MWNKLYGAISTVESSFTQSRASATSRIRLSCWTLQCHHCRGGSRADFRRWRQNDITVVAVLWGLEVHTTQDKAHCMPWNQCLWWHQMYRRTAKCTAAAVLNTSSALCSRLLQQWVTGFLSSSSCFMILKRRRHSVIRLASYRINAAGRELCL